MLIDIIVGILNKAEKIEKEKNGKALLEDEIKTLKAADFLRKIMPLVEGKV